MIHSIRIPALAKTVLLLASAAAGGQAFAVDNVALAPSALNRPALISPKAATKAMLAMARAGSRLVAAGERGIVQYSDDEGVHWQQAATPTSATLVALRFADDKQGWAIGHMGVVLHTDDGGLSWTKQLDGIQAAKLVVDAAQVRGDEKAIANAQRLLTEGADKPFFDLFIESAKTAFVVGAFNQVFRTTDAGKTWQTWQDHLENPKSLHLHAIRKAGNVLLIVGEQGLLLRSDDGGEHFRQITSPYTGTWFGLLTTKSGQVIAYGLRGNAFASSDAGSNWQKLQTGTQVSISAATQLHDGRVLLVSQAGELLTATLSDSTDATPTFTPLAGRPGLPVTDVTQAGDSHLALASLRGVVTLPLAAVKP